MVNEVKWCTVYLLCIYSTVYSTNEEEKLAGACNYSHQSFHQSGW